MATLKARIALALLAAAVAAPAAAQRKNKKKLDLERQDDSDNEMLIDGDDMYRTGYGSIYLRAAPAGGQSASWVGVRGGWVLNELVVVGIDLFALQSRIKPLPSGATYKDQIEMRSSGAGLLLEYISDSGRFVHPLFSLTVGRGSVETTGSYPSFGVPTNEFEALKKEEAYTLILPEVAAEMNVTKYVRLTAGAGYHMALGLDKDKLPGKGGEVGGLTLTLGFRIGNFRY